MKCWLAELFALGCLGRLAAGVGLGPDIGRRRGEEPQRPVNGNELSASLMIHINLLPINSGETVVLLHTFPQTKCSEE